MVTEIKGTRIVDVFQEIERHEGTRVLRLLAQLNESFYTFKMNYRELMIAIEPLEKDFSIWSLENRLRLRAVMREMTRRFHNYVASAYSLFEHAHRFSKELKAPQFSIDYERKLVELNQKTARASCAICAHLHSIISFLLLPRDLALQLRILQQEKAYTGKVSYCRSKNY